MPRKKINEQEIADLINKSDEESLSIKINGGIQLLSKKERSCGGFCYNGQLSMGLIGEHDENGKKVYSIGSEEQDLDRGAPAFAMTIVAAEPWKPAMVQSTMMEFLTGKSSPCIRTYAENMLIDNMPAEIRIYLKPETPDPHNN